MTQSSMRERAAKVCEEMADEAISSHAVGPLRTAAFQIRALELTPDPTRAALEECVRAMEAINLTEAETGCTCYECVAGRQFKSAITTARNALGTEK